MLQPTFFREKNISYEAFFKINWKIPNFLLGCLMNNWGKCLYYYWPLNGGEYLLHFPHVSQAFEL